MKLCYCGLCWWSWSLYLHMNLQSNDPLQFISSLCYFAPFLTEPFLPPLQADGSEEHRGRRGGGEGAPSTSSGGLALVQRRLAARRRFPWEWNAGRREHVSTNTLRLVQNDDIQLVSHNRDITQLLQTYTCTLQVKEDWMFDECLCICVWNVESVQVKL